MSDKKQIAHQCSVTLSNAQDLWTVLYLLDEMITFDDTNKDIIQTVRRLDAEIKGMSALVENWKKTVQS